MAAPIEFPWRGRGRQSAEAEARYEEQLQAFCAAILEINSSLDFQVSARGWCYILEEYGLNKGDFDKAQTLMAQCRKDGLLPLNIVAEDSAREFINVEDIDSTSFEEEAEVILDYVKQAHHHYTPMSFWENQEFFVQMLVEKIDLKSLFAKVCTKYHIPIANTRGWADINSRAAMMERFAEWEEEGKRCVLLYCGDHDPGGLQISEYLRSNLWELTEAVDYMPSDLVIDRFGLNYDFIIENNLTWIDNLETGSGQRLDHPRHKDHHKPYVQDYLKQFGARKVEANALVVRPEAGRALCEQAILNYVDPNVAEDYGLKLAEMRDELRVEVQRLLEVR
jgi:hypothetical protein